LGQAQPAGEAAFVGARQLSTLYWNRVFRISEIEV